MRRKENKRKEREYLLHHSIFPSYCPSHPLQAPTNVDQASYVLLLIFSPFPFILKIKKNERKKIEES